MARSTQESIQVILDAMTWLGMDWDEGPYYQTQRISLYQEAAEKLLKEGKAYRCYCTPEELEAKREAALKAGTQAQVRSNLPSSEPPIRTGLLPSGFSLRMREPPWWRISFRGGWNLTIPNWMISIILRSDGFPTYNFSVVVDDATMEITHVIRGNDHLNNTPRQIQIYQALGYPLPRFGHVSMILGPDKKKLSKRHGAQSVMEYQKMGYLPQAVVNYLVRLGWSYGDQEEFTTEELIEKFTSGGGGKIRGGHQSGKARLAQFPVYQEDGAGRAGQSGPAFY